MLNYSKRSLLLPIAILLASCSSDHDRVVPEIVQVERVVPYHVVEDGDSVGSISLKYEMSRADLIALNNLRPPYHLYEGQRLVIILKADHSGQRGSESKPSVSDRLNDETKSSIPENSFENEVTTSENDEGDVVAVQDESPKPVSRYMWPVADGRNRISQSFEDGGIIIGASAGTPVRSIADGIVKIAGVPDGDAADYGVTVVIKHDVGNLVSIYANLQEATVSKLKKVKKGDVIGKVGKSGIMAKKAQLYFEMNDVSGKERRPIDPEKILP
jgi:lipoprotein NlpD